MPPDATIGPNGEALLVISPTTVDFGDVGAGISTAPFVEFTVINKGQLESGPVQAQLQFTDAALFKLIGVGCLGARIPPLADCKLQLQFRPDTPTGLKQARLVVSAAPGGDMIVPVQGNAVVDTSPRLVASANHANFGTRALGTLSTPISFTITNNGAMPSGPINVAVSGATPGVYGANTSCGVPLAGGSMCFLSLTFRPTAVVAEQGMLVMNANPGGMVTIQIVGTGASISLATDSMMENFGPLIVGFSSQPIPVTVRNNGGDPGLVTTNFGGMHPGDFSLATDSCSGNNLGGGGTCQVGLRFAPQAAGNRSATLVIDANGSSQTVTMTGTGAVQQSPKFVASPLVHDFGDETVGATTPSKVFTITNHGLMTSDTIAVTIGGSSASSFATTSTCTTLVSGASCTVAVTFNPQITGGLSAPITVSAPGATPVTVSAIGNGI